MSVSETTIAGLDEHLQGSVPVLLDLWAPWCGPCQRLAPHLDILADQFAGKIKVLKLNVDECEDAFDHFAVRSIPSLIFYVNGKEHDRLTGTSSLRLKETVKKWLRELGASLPEEVAVQPDTDDNVSEPRKWCAFGGDAALKTAAVARLLNGLEPNRWRRPAALLAGDQTFEAAMGMPQALSDLLDFAVVFREPIGLDKQSARKVDVARVLSIVGDLPVGGDLGPAVIGAVHDLMYVSPWAVPQYFDQGGIADLMAKLACLHDRECAGEYVSRKERADLVRQSIERIGVDTNVDDSKRLEMLAVPLTNQDLFLLTSMMVNETMHRQFGGLSEADKARMHEIDTEDDERVMALLGEPPNEAVELWQECYVEHRERLNQERREEEPEMWARHDAYERRLLKIRSDIATYVLDGLRSRLCFVTH